MGSLSETGYKVKTQNEFYEEEKTLYQNIDPNWLLDPSTPDGLKIAHDAEVFSALDQLVKSAYDARDPNKATGNDLDVLRALTGSTRSQGTPSTTTLSLTGVAGTLIRMGSRVQTNDGIQFQTDQDVIIGNDGTAQVEAHCTQNGSIEVSAQTLTNIVDNISGWHSVTNRSVANIGTNRDSDSVFRAKSAKAVARAGSAQKDSIYGEIFAVEGVRKVRIYENKTDSSSVQAVTNPYGLPPHSMAIIVDGGASRDVAQAIYNKLCPGVMLHAAGTSVSETIYSQNYPNSYDVITFSRPIDVQVRIALTIQDPLGTLPSDDEIQELIRDAYMDYYEGDLLPSGIGFLTTGFDIGDIVPYTRLFTPPNKVLGNYQGTYVSDLKVNNGTSNVAIDFNELARFTRANITVTVQRVGS